MKTGALPDGSMVLGMRGLLFKNLLDDADLVRVEGFGDKGFDPELLAALKVFFLTG